MPDRSGKRAGTCTLSLLRSPKRSVSVIKYEQANEHEPGEGNLSRARAGTSDGAATALALDLFAFQQGRGFLRDARQAPRRQRQPDPMLAGPLEVDEPHIAARGHRP